MVKAKEKEPIVLNMLGLPASEVVERFDEAKLRKKGVKGHGKKRQGRK